MDRFLFMGEVVKTILNSLNKRKDNMDDRKRGWATKWSEEEDEVIRQYYPQNGWKKKFIKYCQTETRKVFSREHLN